ncbi:calcitonin receptor like receptor [Pitangus sulphuratus]|nr:calcitonin receptor like receptor [Pitangus sulphuratus]
MAGARARMPEESLASPGRAIRERKVCIMLTSIIANVATEERTGKEMQDFEFIQPQHKIRSTDHGDDKKLDHVFALLIGYYGPYCNRTWDGWLCWSDVAAGTVSVQRCPDYFQDFNPSEKVTKICDPNGNWFRHPESNRTWTNYTQCNSYTHEKVKTALNLYYLAIIGHGLSIASLLISLGIFFYFKSLSCQRITLHKNLFFSFVCNSVVTIISLTAVANNQELVATNPVNLFFLLNIVRVLITKLKDTHKAESNLYMKAVRATLILVPLLGIEFVLFPWRPEGRIAEEVYDYVMHILMHYQHFPTVTVHFSVSSTKHQDPNHIRADTSGQKVNKCDLLAEKFSENKRRNECRNVTMQIMVLALWVQAVLRRHWNQYKIQFEHSFSHSDAMRTASYTVSTISDVPGYGYSHDCASEHLNGKGYHDMESVVLKTEKLYG